MTDPAISGIHRATEGDRPLLARFVPRWFARQTVEAGWIAATSGRVEAVAMLAPSTRVGTLVEFGSVSDDAFVRWCGPLIDRLAAEARSMGLNHLDLAESSRTVERHPEPLRSLGFTTHETFDEYDIPIPALLEPTRALRDRMAGRVSSRVRPDILEVDARHLEAMAEAWASWIGGDSNRSIDRLRRRFHRSPDPGLRRLQLVAVSNDRLVGFASGRLTSPTELHIDAEAVAPEHRLDPFFLSLKTRFYENAVDLGAERVTFSAGRRQPDTRTLARRHGVEPARSRPRLRLSLTDDRGD